MSKNQNEEEPTVDVAVIGGGAAGLSAGLTLARARRSVIVVDAGSPRNRPADGVHGFLTRDGIAPAELVARGRAEVEHYGGRVLDDEAVGARRSGAVFQVTLAGGGTVTARRLLLSTGLVDELPDIPGLRERWGRDVVHCPYCHGWEIRDLPVGVLGGGSRSVQRALLLRQWSPDVVLFRHDAPALTDDEAEQLAACGIGVVSGPVAGLEITDDRLTGVRLQDGTVVARQAVAVMTRMQARSAVLADLGLTTVEHPLGVGEHVAADPTGRTEVDGVWVAGNVTDLMAQVVTAASAGVVAGAALNADLIAEDTARAVARHRERLTAGAA
jgi:thioredoxin reductase